MVGGQAVVQEPNLKALQLLAQHRPVTIAITGELQQERPIVAAVRDMEDPSATQLICSPHDLKPTAWSPCLTTRKQPKNRSQALLDGGILPLCPQSQHLISATQDQKSRSQFAFSLL